MAVLAGSTPKYLLRLYNEAGVQLDPSNLSQVLEVKVFIYNAITGEYVGRFILRESPLPSGFTRLSTKVVETGDVRVLMVLTSAMTSAAAGARNEIQIDIHVPDADVTGGVRIIKNRGKFHEILKAKL
jgi:hypothetical protein